MTIDNHPNGLADQRNRPAGETPSADRVLDATEILPADAPAEQWRAQRREGIGGSDALAVLGLSPYTSRLKLFYDKIGELPETRQTVAMELGHLLEPVVAELFHRRTGLALTNPGMYAHRERPWQRANPDRFTSDGGILEIKTTAWYSDDADTWEAGEIPDHAETQLQHYMAVTGIRHGYAAALIDGRTLHWKRIEADDEFAELLTDAEENFWYGHVRAGVPPVADGSEITQKMLNRRYARATDSETVLSEQIPDLLSEHRDCKKFKKGIEGRIREIENQIKQELGEHEFGTGPDGLRLVQWRPQTSTQIDTDRLKSEYPLVYEDCQVAKPIRVFVNKLPALPEGGAN